jgi:predicted MPP superfamily phosphohydrolase
VPTILLAHYPSAFAGAAARDVELTLSGHTHGGQIGVPFLAQRLNFARLFGQASQGLQTSGKSQLYVNAGLGTSGPPLRLGIPPEIALIVLRRA